MTWDVAIISIERDVRLEEERETALQVLREMVEQDMKGEVSEIRIVPADMLEISASLLEMIEYHRVGVVFTIGGIGIQPNDVVPEATIQVVDRLIPGLAEAIRSTLRRRDPQAIMNRGVAGSKEGTIVVNLPDDPNGIMESMETIMRPLVNALHLLRQG